MACITCEDFLDLDHDPDETPEVATALEKWGTETPREDVGSAVAGGPTLTVLFSQPS